MLSIKKLTSLLAALALLVIAASPASAETVHFGSLSSFDGPGGLDLTAEGSHSFAYAVNFEKNDPDRAVSGLTFVCEGTDCAPVAGVTVTSSNYYGEYFHPEFGDTTDDNNLEDIMDGFAYFTGTNRNIDVAVTSGQVYKLQLLFQGDNGVRIWDIVIEGSLAVDEFYAKNYDYHLGIGAVYTYEFTAGDNNLDIDLPAGTTTGADTAGLLSAMTLEVIPEPGTLVLLGLGSLGLLLRRRRR